MTLTTSPKPAHPARSHVSHVSHASHRSARSEHLGRETLGHGTLGRYTNQRGRQREIVARRGHAGTTLVLDRDAATLGDRRLIAHLAAEEPSENASIVCRHYLRDSDGRWCRPIAPEDLLSVGPTEDTTGELACDSLLDVHGCARRLGLVQSSLAIPELRWLVLPRDEEPCAPQPVSLRAVVGSLESYEPVRALTVGALARHRADPAISVAVLRAELARLDASRIVLNRGLRGAVLDATRTQELSMSEIAVRCGRVKYDVRGNMSGETSWLARRVGIAPEGGECTPTPWIHSEVLGLIARAGLGISPREVELG